MTPTQSKWLHLSLETIKAKNNSGVSHKADFTFIALYWPDDIEGQYKSDYWDNIEDDKGLLQLLKKYYREILEDLDR